MLSVSIGESADFFYALTEHGQRHRVVIESGDIVIFNGGQLWHGVERVHSGTAPALWTSGSDNPLAVTGMSRLVLQFRDPVRGQLSRFRVAPSPS